jgi:DNA polymerase-3 subunit beta
LIKSDGKDAIEIVATDLDVSIRCRCEAEVKKPGAMLVHARKLFDVVRSLPEAEISFKKDEQAWAVLQCERSRVRIVGQQEEHYPTVPDFKSARVSFSANKLRYFIEHTIFAITQEESQRYALNGAQFLLSKNIGRMIATDGHRLAFVEHKEMAEEGLNEEIRVLIPKKTLGELLKMAADASAGDTKEQSSEEGQPEKTETPVFFERDENHLFFKIGTRVLISRTLSGQFPNYELVMPKEIQHSMSFLSEQIASAIRRVALMADEKSRAVKLHIGEGRAEITSQNSEVGEGSETVPVEYAGPEINLGFNSQYLLDFLQSIDSEEVYFEFKDVQSQAQLRPKNGGEYDYRYVVMPMRI